MHRFVKRYVKIKRNVINSNLKFLKGTWIHLNCEMLDIRESLYKKKKKKSLEFRVLKAEYLSLSVIFFSLKRFLTRCTSL